MSDTEVLPAPVQPGYRLRSDRCVIEPSMRFLRFPVARARFAATAGYLDISEEPGLVVELDVVSLRTYPWPLRRLILKRRITPVLTFISEEVFFDQKEVHIEGRIGDRMLVLDGDLRHSDEDRVVLWAKGILPRPRRAPWFARRLHVEIAIEFVR